MKRRQFLKTLAAPALLAAPHARAQAKQKITYAHLLDPVYEAGIDVFGEARGDANPPRREGLVQIGRDIASVVCLDCLQSADRMEIETAERLAPKHKHLSHDSQATPAAVFGTRS